MATAAMAESSTEVRATLDAKMRPTITLTNNLGKDVSFTVMSHTWQESFVTDVEGIEITSTVPGGNAAITVQIKDGGKHTFLDEFHTVNGARPGAKFKIGFKFGERVYWSNQVEVPK